MIKRRVLSILLMSTLTGCVSLAPHSSTLPEAGIPSNIGKSEHAQQDWHLSQLGWRGFFHDAQLLQLIESALANNPDIQLAVLKTQESYLQYGVEQSNRYPHITGQSSMTYTGQNQQQTAKNYKIDATISYELDFFGRLNNLSQAQRARYLATQEAQRNVYMLLVAQVAQAYLNEHIIIQKQITLDKQLANYQQALSLTASRLVSGEATYLDYEQAKGMLESTKISQSELAQQRQLAHHTLQNLVNRYDVTINPVKQPLQLEQTIPANVPSTVLLTRPDILQAEHQLTAANADIGVARAAFFPSISLTGNVGNASTELADLLSGATLWDLVPKISLPIFNGKQNRLNLDLANNRQQQAAIEYQKTLQNAFKEVADLLTLGQSYHQQFELQQRYLTTQQNALALSTQAYLNGSANYLTILDAQRNVLSTQLALLTLKQNQLTNQINLFIALGGGGQE